MLSPPVHHLLIGTLAVLGFALTQAPAQDASITLLSDPPFEILLTDGSTRTGRLENLSFGPGSAGNVVLDSDKSTPISWASIVRIARVNPQPPASRSLETLVLPHGDILRGRTQSADADSLSFTPDVDRKQPLQLPINRLLGVVIDRTQESPINKWLNAMQDRTRPTEAVWLTNGDRRPWSLVKVDGDQLSFETDADPITLPRSSVSAVGFDVSTARRAPSGPSPYLEASFADGSRFGWVAAQLQHGTISAQTRFGPSITIALEDLQSLHTRHISVDYLADRTPAATEFIPYIDRHPGSIGLNTTWDGYPILLKGRGYHLGLGMLPRTLAVYRIEPGDLRFQATLGVDDRAGDKASVQFRVLLDRKEAYLSPLLTPASQPVHVDIPLKDARLLILVAEFAERGDVHDSACWVEARIIRDPAAASTTPPIPPTP